MEEKEVQLFFSFWDFYLFELISHFKYINDYLMI